MFVLGPLFGPVLGPILGGFIAQRAGWRVRFGAFTLWVVQKLTSCLVGILGCVYHIFYSVNRFFHSWTRNQCLSLDACKNFPSQKGMQSFPILNFRISGEARGGETCFERGQDICLSPSSSPYKDMRI